MRCKFTSFSFASTSLLVKATHLGSLVGASSLGSLLGLSWFVAAVLSKLMFLLSLPYNRRKSGNCCICYDPHQDGASITSGGSYGLGTSYDAPAQKVTI